MNYWENDLGVYLIAEIGGNHEGNFDYALELTELACKSGVDAVKYQVYTGDTLVNPIIDPDRNQHFKKFELNIDHYKILAATCESHGVKFTASVWNTDALKWINRYIDFYKIGSGDMTCYPMLKEIALIGKPIVLSTGLSTFSEVVAAVEYIRKVNSYYLTNGTLAVLQCTSMYPIPNEDANLLVIGRFARELDVIPGYSDHTIGSQALKTAVALGARVLEMHFTDSREGKTFRDHKVSLTCDEIIKLTSEIKEVISLMGNGQKTPTLSEMSANHVTSFRRAVYPVRDLEKGHVICADDLIVLRPNKGIDAKYYEKILGSITKSHIRKFCILDWQDFE